MRSSISTHCLLVEHIITGQATILKNSKDKDNTCDRTIFVSLLSSSFPEENPPFSLTHKRERERRFTG